MEFKPVTRADIARLRPFLTSHPFRSCDFTTGGIFLWADAFDYRYAISRDTLFISGRTVNDPTVGAFSLPLGALPLEESIAMLRDHCSAEGRRLTLSSVPEEVIPLLIDLDATHVEQLTDWSDYVYDAQALSTFAGKKLSKKRNHLNRFASDHPDATVRPVTAADADELIGFCRSISAPHTGPWSDYDREMTLSTIRNLDDYPFEGLILSTPADGIVAFALGESVGDTLHVHIEKMNHEVTGSGETICRDFTARMMSLHPEIRWVNRQDDSGVQGLRHAKLALHPAFLIHKYNVGF